jgi:hypothetical protein
MKFISIAVLTLCSTAFGKEHRVATYDKFKDVTFISSRYLTLTKTFIFEYSCQGHTADCEPTAYYLAIPFRGKNWRFVDKQSDLQFEMMLDGRRLPARKAEWKGDTVSDGVRELVTAEIPSDEFKTILNGHLLEIQIGDGKERLEIKEDKLRDTREAMSSPAEFKN